MYNQYASNLRDILEYLIVVVSEGAQAAHDVLVGPHHLKDVVRICELGLASRMFDAAAHSISPCCLWCAIWCWSVR